MKLYENRQFVVKCFKNICDTDEDDCDYFHHENIAAFEKAFQNNKDKLIIVLLESSNPFVECQLELANVVSKLL